MRKMCRGPSHPGCVNCDGDHTANNIKSPEYQKKLGAAQERRKRNSKHEKYGPAPLPKENAWEKRKKKHKQ
jgi:ribosomal protein L44E